MWVGDGVGSGLCADSYVRFSFAANDGDSADTARGEVVTAIGSRTAHGSATGAGEDGSGRSGSGAAACRGSGHAGPEPAGCPESRSSDGDA